MKGISLNEIEEYSKSLGFQDFKATNFRDFSIYSKNLREFIENKFYGEMGWIKEKSFIKLEILMSSDWYRIKYYTFYVICNLPKCYSS